MNSDKSLGLINFFPPQESPKNKKHWKGNAAHDPGKYCFLHSKQLLLILTSKSDNGKGLNKFKNFILIKFAQDGWGFKTCELRILWRHNSKSWRCGKCHRFYERRRQITKTCNLTVKSTLICSFFRNSDVFFYEKIIKNKKKSQNNPGSQNTDRKIYTDQRCFHQNFVILKW